MTEILPASELATQLGIPVDAVTLCRSAELVDLHLDSFIPVRLWGYDLFARHGGMLGGRFFGQLDVPRMLDGGLDGGMWSITTNPTRGPKGRLAVLAKNVARLRALVDGSSGRMAIARTRSEYDAVRRRGAHAVLMAIQGGNALEAAPEGPAFVPDDLLTRVTVVHLSNSVYGTTSSPAARGKKGLTDRGRELVRQLDQARVFVDLAHIDRQGFWDAVDVHDRARPLIVTHTGVTGVHEHWRNIDDAQVKAVADSGGTIGVMFQRSFLQPAGRPNDGRLVVDHLEHIIKVAGEDFASIGSDYDGAIVPPPDIRSAETYPRLVAYMLERGWSDVRIRKVLGDNFLRAFALLRP